MVLPPVDSPLQTVIGRLEALGKRGKNASWQCPAHDDDDPSLRVALGNRPADGRVVLKCLAGCKTKDVVAALGLTVSDLFPPEKRLRSAPPRPDLADLEQRYIVGSLRMEYVELGELPDDATEDMRRIAADLRLLFSLHRYVGETRPMPYSARFAARRLGWPSGHTRASIALRKLREANVILGAGELRTQKGQCRGTRLYAPPLLAARNEVAAVTVEVDVEPAPEVVHQPAVNRA